MNKIINFIVKIINALYNKINIKNKLFYIKFT